MLTFNIHESNIDRLEKKLTRIQNKCNKYGCEFHYARVGELFKTFEEGTKDEHTERYIVVEAQGTAVVNGWEFAATIQHLEAGNIIRSAIDIEIPSRYYDSDPVCEHCNSRRHRKETYIVHNTETDEFKQVGSSCLCDFTGGLSAEGVAGYIEMFDELIQGEAPGEGYTFKRWYNVVEILSLAFAVIDKTGFTSTSAAYEYGYVSTRSRVDDIYCLLHGWIRIDKERKLIEEFIQDNKISATLETIDARVNEAVKFILSSEEDNNYFHNLKVVCASELVNYSQLGILVSAAQVYNREVEKVKRRRAKAEENTSLATSEYQGEVGQRMTIHPVSYKLVTSFESVYGYCYLYQFLDSDGNVYMWSTSNEVSPYDDNYKLDSLVGTVKEHKEYNGIKQTFLTRCKVKFVDTVDVAEAQKINERAMAEIEAALSLI